MSFRYENKIDLYIRFWFNGPKSLPKNPRDCPILCSWDFDNSILAEEWLAKALQNFETCVNFETYFSIINNEKYCWLIF